MFEEETDTSQRRGEGTLSSRIPALFWVETDFSFFFYFFFKGMLEIYTVGFEIATNVPPPLFIFFKGNLNETTQERIDVKTREGSDTMEAALADPVIRSCFGATSR